MWKKCTISANDKREQTAEEQVLCPWRSGIRVSKACWWRSHCQLVLSASHASASSYSKGVRNYCSLLRGSFRLRHEVRERLSVDGRHAVDGSHGSRLACSCCIHPASCCAIVRLKLPKSKVCVCCKNSCEDMLRSTRILSERQTNM